ncbi:MAG: IspD/TarI family cytidylyltransferase [Cyclonatronaceae bacterium]
MNVAVIFAGGMGSRMNSREKPKQFLEMHGKAIIIHTLDLFEDHPEIEGIVIACVEEYIDYLKKLLVKFHITKVVDVVPGGETGQMSIYNGLAAASKHYPGDSIVLVHDGVRPLIDKQTITDNIAKVKECGSAVTTAPTVETFVVMNDHYAVSHVPDRESSKLAKAPQSFILSDILSVHKQAQKDGIVNSIDSCTLMKNYGKNLCLVDGPVENIKITTKMDYYIFRAIFEARENTQIL